MIYSHLIGGSSGSGLMISKSGSVVSSEVRVGVSQSLIVFAQTLGGKWLERNLRTFVGFLLTELLSHPKTTSTHTDAVFARRCVGHIIRALVGRLLSEKAQLSACKDLVSEFFIFLEMKDFYRVISENFLYVRFSQLTAVNLDQFFTASQHNLRIIKVVLLSKHIISNRGFLLGSINLKST